MITEVMRRLKTFGEPRIVSEASIIQRLRDAGLLVSAWEALSPYPGGYSIGKPVSVHGNARNYEYVWMSADGSEVQCTGPGVDLYPQDDRWWFQVHEWVPGPGAGDFNCPYDSLDDAVTDVLGYFFGDAFQMNPPELLKFQGQHSFWEALCELGEDPTGRKCKRSECSKVRMSLSAYCRAHHYESITGEPAPE